MIIIIDGLEVFINQGGGVTVKRPGFTGPGSAVSSSSSPEAVLLYGILQKLNNLEVIPK